MNDPFSIAIESDRSQNTPGALSLSRNAKPFATVILALAVAITLWGFCYRISLYVPQQNTALRASVTRFWVERRCAQIVANVDHSSKVRSVAHLLPLLFNAQEIPDSHSDLVSTPTDSDLRAQAASSLLPARAPPSMLSFLA